MSKAMANAEKLLQLEEDYWTAMRNNDVDQAVALTKFPCVVASAKGAQSITEDEYRKMMKSNTGAQYRDVKIENPQVQALNDTTAVISYSTQINGMKMLDISTWVRENDRWACAFHSETPLATGSSAKG